jgi:hypothetical protein
VKVEFPKMVVGVETWLTWALVNFVIPWLGFWCCGGRGVVRGVSHKLVNIHVMQTKFLQNASDIFGHYWEKHFDDSNP